MEQVRTVVNVWIDGQLSSRCTCPEDEIRSRSKPTIFDVDYAFWGSRDEARRGLSIVDRACLSVLKSHHACDRGGQTLDAALSGLYPLNLDFGPRCLQRGMVFMSQLRQSRRC